MMSGQTVQHVGRVVRLVLFTLASSALFVNTVNTWAVRYPLIGVGLALLEVLYRTAVPVVTAESLTSSDATALPEVTDATANAVRTHPGYGIPAQGIDAPRNPDGTWPAATVSNPPAPEAPTTPTAPEG